MLNQDQEYIYNKEIQVVNINKAYVEVFTQPDTANLEKWVSPQPSLKLSFFPESGDLVAGIDSRVAIKIENYAMGLGDLTGRIEDISGNLVVPFKIFERGYGLASFTPKAGEEYVAKLDNDPKLYPLPEVKDNGYNITVFNKAEELSLILSSSSKAGLSGGALLIHSRGKVVFHEKLNKVISNSHVLQFDPKEIPGGVTHITFFDQYGVPRSERLIFVDNHSSESVIRSDKKSYNIREKVELNLAMIDKGIKSYDCSVSVVDKSSIPGTSSDNIKSWMLLNSDLRGKIIDPTYYFEQSDDNKRLYLLDLVMMTHGWRRFTWEDMSKPNVFQELQYEKEDGLYIKGYTGRLLRKKVPVRSKVRLNLLDNELTHGEVITEEDGRFSFGPLVFADSVTAVIQARKYKEESEKDFLEENNKININLDHNQTLGLKKFDFIENKTFDYASYNSFVASNKYNQFVKDQYAALRVDLSEVVLVGKKKSKEAEYDKIVTEKSLYSNPTNRIVVDEKARTVNRSVFDMLRNVPGVIVNEYTEEPTVTIRNLPSGLCLIDGVPVEYEALRFLNANDVMFIDVLKGASAAIYGSRVGGGVVAVYTRTDAVSYESIRESGILKIVIGGFDKNRQFYSPDYSKDVSSVYVPDARTTLYWNPYVVLTSTVDTPLSFFTGDNKGDYLVVLEGLSDVGDPIYGTYEFSVN